MLRITIPSTVKFSYKYTRGTYSDSIKNAQNVVNDTISEFIDMGYPQTTSVNKLKKIIRQIIPEKKRIDIKPINENNPEVYGYQDYLTEVDSLTGKEKYLGYVISLPIKNGRFQLSNLPIFIHEFTHVLNALFTPKYTSQLLKSESLVERITSRSVTNVPNFSKQYYGCYDKSLYVKEEYSSLDEIPNIIDKRKKEILKMLKNRTSEERIVILQNFRYFLQSEKCAYESENSLYTLLRKYGLTCNKELLELESSKFLLDAKIQMLKDMCYEEIQKARVIKNREGVISFEH